MNHKTEQFIIRDIGLRYEISRFTNHKTLALWQIYEKAKHEAEKGLDVTRATSYYTINWTLLS